MQWWSWRCQTVPLQTYICLTETTINQLTTTYSQVVYQSPLDHNIISGSSIINSCWCRPMIALSFFFADNGHQTRTYWDLKLSKFWSIISRFYCIHDDHDFVFVKDTRIRGMGSILHIRMATVRTLQKNKWHIFNLRQLELFGILRKEL